MRASLRAMCHSQCEGQEWGSIDRCPLTHPSRLLYYTPISAASASSSAGWTGSLREVGGVGSRDPGRCRGWGHMAGILICLSAHPQGMMMFFSPSKARLEFKSVHEALDHVLYTTQHADIGRLPTEVTEVQRQDSLHFLQTA